MCLALIFAKCATAIQDSDVVNGVKLQTRICYMRCRIASSQGFLPESAIHGDPLARFKCAMDFKTFAQKLLCSGGVLFALTLGLVVAGERSVAWGQESTQPHKDSAATGQRPLPPKIDQPRSRGPGKFRQADVDKGQPPSPPPIVDSWSGVYFEYPYFKAVKVKLASPIEDVGYRRGAAQILRFVPGKSTRQNKNSVGSFELLHETSVKAIVNPLTYEMRFFLMAPPDRRGKGMIHTFTGVLALNPLIFAGHMNRASGSLSDISIEVTPPGVQMRHGFVMAPSEQGGEELLQFVLKMHIASRNYKQMTSTEGLSTQASGEQLKAILWWASRFAKEYPRVNIRNTKSGKLHKLAANLFADSHFQQVFGSRFDELSPRQSEAIGWLFQSAKRGNYGEEIRNHFREISPFGRYFQISGAQSRADTLGLVWPRRAIRRWLSQRREWLNNVDAYPTLSSHADQLKTTFRCHLKDLFPSEQSQDQSIAVATKKAKPVEIDSQITALLEQKPSTMTVHDLSRWKESIASLLDLSDSSELDKYEPYVAARMSEVLPIVVSEQVATFAAFSNEYSSIQKVNNLYFFLHYDFKNVSDDPRVKAMFLYATELHSWLVSEHRATILKRISSIESQTDLKAYKHGLFLVPNAIKKQDTEVIRAEISQRFASFARAQKESYYSLRELSLMDDNGQVRVPANCAPPTEKEILLAVVRSHVAAVGKMTGPDSFEVTVRTLIPGPDGKPMLIGRSKMRVREIEILGDSVKQQGVPCGYEVRYRMRAENEIRDNPFDRDNKMARMLNLLSRDIGGATWSEPLSETFVLGKSGWTSPSITKSVSTAAPVVGGKIME